MARRFPAAARQNSNINPGHHVATKFGAHYPTAVSALYSLAVLTVLFTNSEIETRRPPRPMDAAPMKRAASNATNLHGERLRVRWDAAPLKHWVAGRSIHAFCRLRVRWDAAPLKQFLQGCRLTGSSRLRVRWDAAP